jgi:hypothetical protein
MLKTSKAELLLGYKIIWACAKALALSAGYSLQSCATLFHPKQGFPLLSFTQNQINKWKIQVKSLVSLFLCGEKMIYAAFRHA